VVLADRIANSRQDFCLPGSHCVPAVFIVRHNGEKPSIPQRLDAPLPHLIRRHASLTPMSTRFFWRMTRPTKFFWPGPGSIPDTRVYKAWAKHRHADAVGRELGAKPFGNTHHGIFGR